MRMGTTMRTRSGRTSARGFTLVELMISLIIGLLVIAGVFTVFFASRTSYTQNEAQSRVQENARIALELLASDLRHAAFMGCRRFGANDIRVNDADVPLAEVDLVEERAIRAEPDGLDGTDEIRIIGAMEDGTRLGGGVGNVVTPGDLSIELLNTTRVPGQAMGVAMGNGDLATETRFGLITDCTKGDLFQLRSDPIVSVPNNKVTLELDQTLNYGYGADAMVFPLKQVVYRIQGSGRMDNSDAEIPSLFRSTDGVTFQEIAEGVESLVVEYGEDTDGNGSVDQYVAIGDATPPRWARVVAVRARLLFVSAQNRVLETEQTYFFDGVEQDAEEGDRRYRQEFTTAVGLRNRLR